MKKPAKSAKPSPAPKPQRPAPALAPSLPTDARRQRRLRPTPAWLLEQRDLDDVARRRCLLILSVLSGQIPVTDAIEGTDLSRQNYYNLEERALKAMLRALMPGSEAALPVGPDPEALKRVAELESKLKQLEQDKRRLERLLLLTRKALRPGPLKTGHRARAANKALSWEGAGPAPSPCSASTTSQQTAEPASIPTPDGAAAG
jgi:hypothetical protein